MAFPSVTIQTTQAVIKYPDGTNVTGTLYATLSGVVIVDDSADATIQHVVYPTTKTVSISAGILVDADGAATTFELVPNAGNSISPTGSVYRIRIIGGKGVWTETWSIANTDPIEYGDITRTDLAGNAVAPFTNPMTTLGDLIYGGASGLATTLTGNTTTTRKFLRQTGTGSASAAPAWDTVTKTDVGLASVENTALSTWAGTTNITTLGTVATGTWSATAVGPTKGGTNQTTWALGDILYASAADTLAKLTGNITTTRKFLRQTGDGAVSAAPAWDTISTADVTDYATTTWTPGITFGGAASGVTYSAQLGTYTKIGNRVFFQGEITMTAKGSSTGAARITGLPFTSAATYHGGVTLGRIQNMTFANQIFARLEAGGTVIDLTELTEAGTETAITDADFTNTTLIYFSGHYKV